MRQSLVSSTQTRRTKRRGALSSALPGAPLTFLLTGFGWLSVSFLLGIGLIIGLIYGTPLPRWLRPIHVHGALVGGILQLAIGGLLLSLARTSDPKGAQAQSRTILFFTLNGATAVLLLSFWWGNMTVAGLAGLLLTGAVLSLTKAAWIHFGGAFHQPAGAGWLYRLALAALVSGLTVGIAMALHLTGGYDAHLRLAHIHLIVLGFMTPAFIVALFELLPSLLQQPLPHWPIARFALWSLPFGLALLLGAFLNSALWLQIGAGGLLLTAIALCTAQMLTIWLRAGSPGSAATDHLLIGAFFLLLAAGTGLAMATNYLKTPPRLPIGSLHLMAYTHLAFIGFITQVIFGGLSCFVPRLLALSRAQNSATREAYRSQLDAIMNRWRTPQLAGMSLGTMALCVLASLTWSLPLSSPYVESTVWIAAGLLVASLTLFAAKLAWAVGLHPSS